MAQDTTTWPQVTVGRCVYHVLCPHHALFAGWRAAIVNGMVAVHDVLVAAAKHSDTFDNQPDLQTELAR